MAATISKIITPEGMKTKSITVALDNSYPTGGYALAPSDFGLSTAIVSVEVGGGSKGYLADYNLATGKLMLYRQTAATSALVEVANAVDVSAVTALILNARGY